MRPSKTSCDGDQRGRPPRSAALRPEEHRAGEVVAFGELGGGPSKRTWPFSRNTARSAIDSATLSDCSTMMIVIPSALSRSTTPSSSCTTSGARPERELVDERAPPGRAAASSPARASAAARPTAATPRCRRRLGEGREQVEARSMRGAGSRRRRRGTRTPPSRGSRATVIAGNTPLPPGRMRMPSCARCSGVTYVMVVPVEPHDAARRACRARRSRAGSSTCRRRSCRAARAPRPCAPRSRRRTAPARGRTRSRRWRPAARGSRRASACWRWCSSISSRSSATTSERSLRMKRAPRMISSPPMIVDGHDDHDHRGRGSERVGEEGREQRAAGGADEEDVDRRRAPRPCRAAGTARPTAAPARPW